MISNDWIETYEDMMKFCRNHREADGFCRCSSACSGPAPSNLACDHEEELPEGVTIYRGGNYGSCCFYVKEDS